VYWNATTAEYGLGTAVSGPQQHARIAGSPPASMTGEDLQQLIDQHLFGDGADFPAYTPQTIYAFYVPPNTKYYDQAGATQPDFCSLNGGGAFHASFPSSTGVEVAYAVNMQCPGQPLTDITLGASHEFLEAATDPYPFTTPGWMGLSPKYFAW